MSTRRQALASYASQVYVSAIGVLMLPVYVRYLGPEGYGLVGIFVSVQAWFQVLDLGASAVLTHQVARWRGGIGERLEVMRRVRQLELRFGAIGALALVAAWALSPYAADHWLRRENLPADTIVLALVLICVTCAARWLGGIYRGVIVGLEQVGSLGILSAAFATVRFIGVLPWLVWSPDPVSAFFWFQLAVGIAESAALAGSARRGLATCRPLAAPQLSVQPVATALGWQLALATIGWLAATQVDRLLLSRLLGLSDFGYFSIALAVAGGLLMLSAPAAQVLLPRLSRLEAAGDQAALAEVYSRASQWMAVLACTLAATLVACAEPILWAWTGDRVLAERTAPILVPYVIGNGMLAISSMPYCLQFARGDLQMHGIGTGLLLLLLIPAWWLVAPRHGGQGTGVVWAIALSAYLLLWTPLVHRLHLRTLGKRSWLARDVLPIMAAAASMAGLAWLLMPRASAGRIEQLPGIAATLALVGAAAATAAPAVRAQLARWTSERSGGTAR